MVKRRLRKPPTCQTMGAMVLLGISALGCVSKPGVRPSIWPTQQIDGNSTNSLGQTWTETANGVKSQFASVGAAMTSAYSKTKTAITTPFSTTSTTNPDAATSLSSPITVAPEILVAQGNYFESQGNYAKALDSYSRALEAEAKNPVALLSMARLYDRQKDSANAIEFYRKVNAAVPNNADAYAELGGVYARAGDLKSAKNELQKAVNLQPQNRGYRASMAGVLLDSGNVDAAFEELRQTDSPATAHYQMACLHFNRKNIPATQQQLQMALQIDPNLKPARDLLASMGGAQNISNMVQQGQQFGQQAMGIYQQTGALVQGASASLSGSVPASPSPVGAAPAFPATVTP